MQEQNTNEQQNKQNAGKTLRQTIEIILRLLKEAKLITDFKGEGSSSSNSPHFGYPDKYSRQFRCDYIYTLSDDTEVMLHTESSYDSGRLKTKEWDSFHIKKINKNIKKSFVLYPDGLKNGGEHTFHNVIKKLRNKEIVTSIDGIYSQTEFLYLLENEVLGEELNGSKAARVGTIFELVFLHTMTMKQNFELWINQSSSCIGWKYDLYKMTLDYLGILPKDVSAVYATRDIPMLPEYTYADGGKKRGGKPKTDVILYVEYKNGNKEQYMFSCKNTSKKNVHVNQFSPKYVVDLLNIEPAEEVQNLLEIYREDGGPRKFRTCHPVEYERLQELFVPYVDDFERWCLCGDSREGSTELQKVTHLISCHLQPDSKEIYKIIDIDSYLDEMHKKKKGTFGTIFSWTVTKKDSKGQNEIRVKARL